MQRSYHGRASTLHAFACRAGLTSGPDNVAAATSGNGPGAISTGIEIRLTDTPRRPASRLLPRLTAGVLTVAIFLVDTLTTLEGAVAVLYVVAVLIAARTFRRRDIIVVATVGIVLTLVAYLDTHGFKHVGSQTVRALVSLAAIGISALMALQNQAAVKTLAAQATLLDLSHDMIFMRDPAGAIRYWNRSAEERYGWSVRDAIGQPADALLQTRYTDDRAAIEAALLATGRWEGALEQTTRTGQVLVLDSRWALQRDDVGRSVGVLETHTDVTERNAAHAALVASELRYRRMFDASRIGVVQQNWTTLRSELARLRIADAAAFDKHLAVQPDFIRSARLLARIDAVNPAFTAMLTASGQSSAPRSVDEVLVNDDRTFAAALRAFLAGDAFHEGETEVVRSDGHRVPVLFTITFPRAGDGDGCILVFVVNITERRLAEDAALRAQAELAHAARVATLGELTASIAHEINQPLMAVTTSGEAALRWLRRPTPDLHEVDVAIARIVAEGRRASDIVRRIRAFLAKQPVQHDALDIATVISEATALVQHVLTDERVETQFAIEAGLPAVRGDRVQLQQVLVNLLLNASQAMSGQSTPRSLSISASQLAEDLLEVSVADSGPGIAVDQRERLFEPFFTTKPHGMGMGLAICRTTVEAHGGRLSVDATEGPGATFRLTLAIAPDAGNP